MIEVLNRKTLTWEPLPLKDRNYSFGARLSNGLTATPLTVLAVRGKERYSGYGYCSNCYKIMTKKEFEKHNHVYAGTNCVECRFFAKVKEANGKCSCDKDGNFIYKIQAKCTYSYNADSLTKGKICPKKSCNGRFIPLEKEVMKLKTSHIAPKEILTIGSMVGNKRWAIHRYKNDCVVFKNKKHNKLLALFDYNGFLLYFSYNKSNYTTYDFIYFTDNKKFCHPDNISEMTMIPDTIKQEVRRLYT